MANRKGTYLTPYYQRIIEVHRKESGIRVSDIAEEIGVSYPTASRAILGHRISEQICVQFEAYARDLLAAHKEYGEKAMRPFDKETPTEVVARRLQRLHGGLDFDKALDWARRLTQGLPIMSL